MAHPPEAVPAFALVGARRVVAGGVAAAVAATQGALVHICNTNGSKRKNIKALNASRHEHPTFGVICLRQQTDSRLKMLLALSLQQAGFFLLITERRKEGNS